MDGKIKACPNNNCNYHCCDFNQNNYIVLFPGEYNYAKEKGYSLDHLHIIEMLPNDGYKAICTAKNRESCDNGYKPVDCKIYPIFPTGNRDYILKGKKCPLKLDNLEAHIIFCIKYLEDLPFTNSKLLQGWLKNVDLVDYEII